MNTLLIPDISHYSTVGSFHSIQASGCPAVICKASQGVSNVDSTYHDFYRRAKEAGLIVGAYHYLMPHNVTVQMDHFLATAKLQKGDLRPIIDAEAPGLDREDTQAALDYLAAKSLRPILYCSLAFWFDTLRAPSDHALWLAAYRSTLPQLPKGVTLFAWQKTDRGAVAGISNPCDLSVFYGDLAALKQFCL